MSSSSSDGSRTPLAGQRYTFAEHWDGSSWSPSPTPSPGYRGSYFNAVADGGPTDAWAVGYTIEHGLQTRRPLAEHWDGSTWSVVDLPKSSVSQLVSVVDIAEDDVWTVGGYTSFHWNGSTWATVAMPVLPIRLSGGLSAVSGSSPTDIWAVGQRYQAPHDARRGPLMAHWDGSDWSLVPGQRQHHNASVGAVEAVSATDVWAVGSRVSDIGRKKSFAEHGDGVSWTDDPTAAQKEGELYSISSTSASDVWVVGYPAYGQSGGFIEHFDGTSWSKVESPETTYGWLSVSADTPTDAWVVSYPNTIAHWDGSTWTDQG